MAKTVVIGGGITGVLTARELLLGGHEVTLLEGEHVGAGSSSRTAAGIRQQFSTEGTVHGMRYSVDFYRRFAEEVEDGQSPIVQNGYLFLIDDEAEWEAAKARVEMQRQAGLTEVEALDADTVVDRFAWVGRDGLIGGTWCPSDGFLIPHLIYNEGARRIRELGGTLLQRAPVTGGHHRGGRLVAVDTPKGRVEGDVFLDCTNAWSPRLAALLGGTELPIQALKRYLWFLGREGSMTADTLGAMPLTICPDGTYVRPENREILQMGRKHDTPSEPDFSYEDQDRLEPDFTHDSDVDALPFQLWANVAEVLPPIGEFGGIQYTTCGYYGTTPDHNPFLGHDPRLPGLIRLVGFSGHGAMMAPFTARVAAALVDADRDCPSIDVDGTSVALDSFRIGRDYAHSEAMVI